MKVQLTVEVHTNEDAWYEKFNADDVKSVIFRALAAQGGDGGALADYRVDVVD